MMDAGRELDALIAEKVMGWTVTAPNWGNRLVEGPFEDCGCPSHSEAADVPPYSTDIGAAWEVVDKLTSTTKQWFRLEVASAFANATFEVGGAGGSDGEWSAEGFEAAHAICLAALEAVGLTIP